MKIGCHNKFSEIFGGENLKRAIFSLIVLPLLVKIVL